LYFGKDLIGLLSQVRPSPGINRFYRSGSLFERCCFLH
jgi:hypothetical protein